MSSADFFEINVKNPTCIEGISEDALRALVDALTISVKDKKFGNVVLSTGGIEIKFQFGPSGSFEGVYAKQNGQLVTLIPGSSSKGLAIFEGPPSAINPGFGWEVKTDLTVKYLGQPIDENQWEIFYASRVSVLNSV